MRYNRLSNPLWNRLYNPVWQPVERTLAVRSTRLSNRVWQPVEQTVAFRSTRLSSRLSNLFDNRLDNRLYRVNGVLMLSAVIRLLVTVLCPAYSLVYTWMQKMDSTGCVPEPQVSSATSINETGEDTTFQQQIEQLQQHMTQLKSSNSFEETVKF